MEKKKNCDVCKESMEGEVISYFRDIPKLGWSFGHKKCLYGEYDGYLKKNLWHGHKGSIGVGHLEDIKHRRVVGQGEVIRDYNRTYHFI